MPFSYYSFREVSAVPALSLLRLVLLVGTSFKFLPSDKETLLLLFFRDFIQKELLPLSVGAKVKVKEPL